MGIDGGGGESLNPLASRRPYCEHAVKDVQCPKTSTDTDHKGEMFIHIHSSPEREVDKHEPADAISGKFTRFTLVC